MNLKDLLGDAYKEDMTVDEITKALESVQMPDDKSAELAKLKDSVSKANSEAAKYKKELNEKLSAEEKKAKEDAERWEKLEKERNELLREKNVSAHKAKFLENGYTAEQADKSAEALVDGDFDTVFKILGEYRTTLEKKFKSEKIDSTPKPQGGASSDPIITKEKFDAMSYTERAKLYQDNKTLYEELSK